MLRRHPYLTAFIMHRSFSVLLFTAALAFAGCDGFEADPTARTASAAGLTCEAPTLHNITPGGSSYVNISYTRGASNGNVGIIGYVQVRQLGTSTWHDAEATSSSTNIKAYQLNEPASGGTTYQVRARQSCSRGQIDGDFETATSPWSNYLVDDLIYYP